MGGAGEGKGQSKQGKVEYSQGQIRNKLLNWYFLSVLQNNDQRNDPSTDGLPNPDRHSMPTGSYPYPNPRPDPTSFHPG